ncbi:MAG: protein translocase subunit SecD [Patescibacteria group bacterium]
MPKRGKIVLLFVVVVSLSVFAAVFDYPPAWEKISDARPWSLGLDVAGGSVLTYEIDLTGVDSGDKDFVVKGLRDVIERRVNLFGVSEPRVYTETVAGTNRLVVELAGIHDISKAVGQIGQTPLLDFRELVEEGTSTVRFVPTELTGRYVKSAQIGQGDVGGTPMVLLEFTDDGAKIFETVTERNIGKRLCIFLDNEIRSVTADCPTVQSKISGGHAQISGNFTFDEVKSIKERFNAGALPAPIKLVNQQTVSADFGNTSLNEAMFAGLIGTAIVMLFMIAFYHLMGIFAAVALIMYVALTLAVFKMVPVTLTLAGIAGFILSIGMAVDANILVFERTKEELKKGLSRVAAIEEGFKRAWPSIRDSNVSTMITSAVLYYFTSSFVKGFALSLFLGVVMSMFSAITITRTMLRLFLKDKGTTTVQSQK